MRSLIYETLPAEFRASDDPEDVLTLWRGDKIGRAATGMICRLGDTEAADHFIYEVASRGVDELNNLIDLHTGASIYSPMISVTNAISRAQEFASHPDETIYRLELPASRLIRDPYAVGRPHRGNDTELFVVGEVTPSDIVAVKTNNEDINASEFLEPHEQTGKVLCISWGVGVLLCDFPDDPSRQPNRYGVWETPSQLTETV